MDSKYLLIEDRFNRLINIYTVFKRTWDKYQRQDKGVTPLELRQFEPLRKIAANSAKHEHQSKIVQVGKMLPGNFQLEALYKEFDDNISHLPSKEDAIDYLIEKHNIILEYCNICDPESGEYMLGDDLRMKLGIDVLEVIRGKINRQKEELRERKRGLGIEEEEELDYKGLPNFNTAERYLIVDSVIPEVIKAIHELDTSASSKQKILSILMNCSPDTSKHILNRTYPPLHRDNPDRDKKIENYIDKLKIGKKGA